jgi:hypothetical protein
MGHGRTVPGHQFQPDLPASSATNLDIILL